MTTMTDMFDTRLAAPVLGEAPARTLAGHDAVAERHRRIAADPRFRALVRARRALGTGLAAVMGAAYFAYILTIAFDPALFGTPLGAGITISWGVVVGAGLLLFGFVLTAIYVVVANTRLDPLTRSLEEIR